MSFRNWAMIWKIVSLLLILGGVSLAGGLYSVQQMRSIDQTYSNLIAGPSLAAVEEARANRAIVSTIAAIYRHIAVTDDAANKQAVEAETASIKAFDEKIALASKLNPKVSEKLSATQRAFHAAYETTCADTLKLADSTDQDSTAKATATMIKMCEPAFVAVTNELAKTNTEMTTDMVAMSDILSSNAISAEWMTLAGIGLGTVAVVVLSVIVVRGGIVLPLRSMMGVMHQLGLGELEQNVPGADRGDEIGAMSRELELLRSQLSDAERLRGAQAQADEIAKIQLIHRESLAQDFVAQMQRISGGFASSSGEVENAAKNLSATAEETSRQAQSVAAAAEEASENVQTVAASSEELAASIREITGQVAHSSKVADSAFAEAEASNARISELAIAASAIGDVVNLIKGIAGQTNLLALNATIEAARAGESGRGFAVVASEVKQLAEQTNRATDEIGAKINEIQLATNGAVNSMKEIARTIASVKEIATSIASAVEEQGAATGEIAANCSRAAEGTTQVTQNISGVGQAAEMTGTASTQLMTLSTGLSVQASDLRKAVESFVQNLNAA